MTNQFDFYCIELHSKHVKPLLKIGISRKRIDTYRDGFKQYGKNSYPIIQYKSMVGFIDVMTHTTQQIDKLITEYNEKYANIPDVRISVQYIARD